MNLKNYRLIMSTSYLPSSTPFVRLAVEPRPKPVIKENKQQAGIAARCLHLPASQIKNKDSMSRS